MNSDKGLHPSVEAMWRNFITANPQYADRTYTSWYFCNTEDCANKLAVLVKQGIKRGTASLYYWYETKGETLPKPGEFSVVTNWNGEAQCIIRALKLIILPFRDVNAEMAFTEGEGDKSLEYWRRVHIEFFTSELEGTGIAFSEELIIVFEEFELVFQ